MAKRFVKLLRTSKAVGTVVLTGGLAMDMGLLAAIEDAVKKAKVKLEVTTHPDAIYAGALGAALWGAFRHKKLLTKEETLQDEPTADAAANAGL
jgi:benzoyl-CoA reductase subunit D